MATTTRKNMSEPAAWRYIARLFAERTDFVTRAGVSSGGCDTSREARDARCLAALWLALDAEAYPDVEAR